MDRSLPTLLVEPLRHAFRLSDAQLGLAVGFAYGAAYGVAGLIVGPLLDRFNRVRMLSGMVLVWSGLTAVCGMVTTFPMLLAARLGVGAAEAGGAPASYAIISGIFPAHRRATAIGLLKVGSPLGVLAASVIAATIAVRYDWRMAFLVAGIPGLLLAILVLIVIPGGRTRPQANSIKAYSFRSAMAFMAKSPGMGWLMAGVIVFMFSAAGTGAFQMSLFQRVHGVSLKDMSWFFGAAQGFGSVGPIAAALICDRLTRRDVRLTLHLFSGICLACLTVGVVMALADNRAVALGALMAWHLISAGMSASAFATVITLTPPHMRGTVTGYLSAAMYLLGIGPAPFITGLISDLLGGGEAVRQAIVIMLLLNVVAVACFVISFRSLRRLSSEKG